VKARLEAGEHHRRTPLTILSFLCTLVVPAGHPCRPLCILLISRRGPALGSLPIIRLCMWGIQKGSGELFL